MLRALIQARMGKTGDQATIDAARNKFADHLKNNTDLSPDLRLTVSRYILYLVKVKFDHQ
jgi:hypothetical protein